MEARHDNGGDRRYVKNAYPNGFEFEVDEKDQSGSWYV